MVDRITVLYLVSLRLCQLDIKIKISLPKRLHQIYLIWYFIDRQCKWQSWFICIYIFVFWLVNWRLGIDWKWAPRYSSILSRWIGIQINVQKIFWYSHPIQKLWKLMKGRFSCLCQFCGELTHIISKHFQGGIIFFSCWVVN